MHFKLALSFCAAIALSACSSPAVKGTPELDRARAQLAKAPYGDCHREAMQRANHLLEEADALASKGNTEAANAKATEALRITNEELLKPCATSNGAQAAATDANGNPIANGITLQADTCTEVLSQLQLPVFFEFNSSDLTDSSRELILQYGELMTRCAEVAVQLAGHADARGSEEYNIMLGQQRANAVMKYLADLGIAPARLKTTSYGEAVPAINGEGEEVWQKNRRVEFRPAP